MMYSEIHNIMPNLLNELCEESMQCRTSFGFTELVLAS